MPLNRKKRNLFIVLALVIGSLFAFVLGEIGIRLFAPQNLSGSWRVVLPSGLSVNKDHGTSQHQQGDRLVNYRFTEYHTRNSKIDVSKKKILVLGDSFTFGWLLNYEDTYVTLLQKKIDESYPDKYELINASAGGWGAASYCRYLEDIGSEINPDIVLVIMSTDDIGRALKSGLYEETENSLKPLVKNKNQAKNFIRGFPGYQFLLENFHLVQLLRKFLLSNHSVINQPHTAAHGPRSRELKKGTVISQEFGKLIFTRIQRWCEVNGASLLVTTNGWGKTLKRELETSDLENLEPTIAFQKCANDYFMTQKIPFYDATKDINMKKSTKPKDYVIPMDCHPNEQGAKLIAEVLWNSFLKEQFKRMN